MISTEIPTRLLLAIRHGDEEAKEKLLSIVYATLYKVAQRQLERLRPGRTLDTTALVHEAFLKLFDESQVTFQDKTHFFALSATVMRQILVDYSRRRRAAKRGGGLPPVPLHASPEPTLQIEHRVVKILDLDTALTRLAALNTRLSQVVELRFFGGFSIEETAQVLAISPRTVIEDWRKARAFLYRMLNQHEAG